MFLGETPPDMVSCLTTLKGSKSKDARHIEINRFRKIYHLIVFYLAISRNLRFILFLISVNLK